MNAFGTRRVYKITRRSLCALFSVQFAFATAPPVVRAQSAIMDEGRFTVTQAGRPIGREEFNIRRTGPADSTAMYIASATANYGDRRVTSALRTTASGAPIAYEADVRRGNESVQRVRGQYARGRFASVSRTSSGESSREDVLGVGTVIVDDEIFHHYYFLLLDRSAKSAVVLVPRRGARIAAQLERVGDDSVAIAGRAFAATHYVLRGVADNRDLWVDARGRVMKVSLPNGIIAVRAEPPR